MLTRNDDMSDQISFFDLVENALFGVAVIQDNRVVYRNSKFRKLFKNFSSLSDETFFNFIHPKDLDKVKNAYQKIKRNNKSEITLNFKYLSRVGVVGEAIKWVDCRISKIKLKDGEAWFVNVIDIPKETTELQYQIQANKLKSFTDLSNAIAHQIRNPLTGINCYLYTLEEICDRISMKIEESMMIRQIIQQIQFASDLIESVVKRSMEFAIPNVPSLNSINLNDCVNEVLQLLSEIIQKNGISIKTQLSTGLPNCDADRSQIEKVINNLISNAVYVLASQDKTKQIEIETHSNNNTVLLTIEDSGPGIGEELKERIYDPFFSTTIGGTGLGLTVAGRIVTDHNGGLSFENRPQGGAKFTVELPIE